jgi:hypothetical protein
MARTARNAPLLLLGAALLASALLILALTWHFTFLQDTWEFLMNRRAFTADSFLEPHNEHIVVIPVAIMQLFLHVFGMSSAKPEYVLLTLMLVASACLIFVYISRRVGQWFALFATVLVLFLGPAWELLVWPFEISLLGSFLFGLAMLLALERGDRRGDVLACVFLTIALGFSSLGIPFVAGALVAILLSPREGWRSRAYVVLVPGLLFTAWYLGWGHEAESHMSLHNVLASPRFVIEAISVGVGNLLGLGSSPVSGAAEIFWGAVLLAVITAVVVWRQLRRPGFDPGLWPVAAAAFVNWFLTAFNEIPGREPAASRYQYASCVFILLVLSNLLVGERFGRRAILIGAAVTALAVAPNLIVLKDGRDVFAVRSVLTKADTGAIEIARRTVRPDFELTPEVAGAPALIDVFAGPYLEAADEYGSPGYTEAELAASPEEARHWADVVLAAALPMHTKTLPGGYDRGGGRENCVAIPPGAAPREEVQVNPGLTRIEVAPGGEAQLTLRRFAEGEFPVTLPAAAGGSATVLHIPRDESPRPWYLHVKAEKPARVCR